MAGRVQNLNVAGVEAAQVSTSEGGEGLRKGTARVKRAAAVYGGSGSGGVVEKLTEVRADAERGWKRCGRGAY